MILIALSLLFIVAAQGQVEKLCAAFQERTLEDLLSNPPGPENPVQLLECIPRKLLRQFTEIGTPHVEITMSCVEDANGKLCTTNGKGYKLVAEALAELFLGQTRCINCQRNHPTVDYAFGLLQRRHPKLLQRAIQILSLQD